jgi:hypothetical protein
MNLSPLPIQKFFDSNGEPLVGGLLYTYVAGTTTKIATYTDSSGGSSNTNPIVLDYRGEARVWLDITKTYKFVLSPRGDTDPPTKAIWTADNLSVPISLQDLTQQVIGLILYPRTTAEIAALVTPTSYVYPELCLERYGGAGDNSTINDTAMTSAIAVATSKGGGVIRCVNGGTYIFSAGFTPPESTTILGTGKLATVLKANGNFTLVLLASTARVHLQDLTLQGTSKTGTGLQIGSTAHCGQNQFTRIRVIGFNEGVRFAAALWITFYDCLIDGNKYGVNYNAGSASMYSNAITFIDTTIQSNDRNGIGATNTPVRGIGLQFIGGSIESNGSEAPATYPQVVLGALSSYYFNLYGIESGAATKPDGFDLSSSSHGEIANVNFLGSATAIKATAASCNNIFIHNCDFNSTQTRCIDLPACTQVTAVLNEYDLTNNVMTGTNSTDASGIAGTTSGSFTGTLTGCTTSPTASVNYAITGKTVTINIPQLLATSNTTACTVTGMPAAIAPGTQQYFVMCLRNNGADLFGSVTVETTGVITLHNGVIGTAFTNVGQKGPRPQVMTYSLL